MLSRPGEHAFAASMSMQLDWSLEGRESMAPPSTFQPMAGDLVTDRVPILLVTLKGNPFRVAVFPLTLELSGRMVYHQKMARPCR